MRGTDKLFLEIGGAPVLGRTAAVFAECGRIDELVVAVRRESFERAAEICARYVTGGRVKVKIVEGGETRLRSVYNGVFAASARSGLIAIHDGARPLITEDLILSSITAARTYGAAALAVPVAATVKRAANGIVTDTVTRDGLYEIQTPQTFDSGIIKAALTNALNKALRVTDDCMAVEAMGFPVRIVEGDVRNIKITTAEDAALAEAILQTRGNAAWARA
jgi:2-C-methyl-D-erythritol 4-phosphate cytidylyltransferase